MGEVIKKKYKGDDYLSSMDLKMWSLVQEILFKWNTLVIFKKEMYNVPNQTKGFISFFVPEDCVFCYEIVSFLEKELEDEIQEETVLTDVTIPGVDVEISTVVHTFSGVPGHVDREIIEQMAKEFTKRLKMEIKKSKKSKE